MCPILDPRVSMQEFLAEQKKGPLLTAKDYVARLMCALPHLRTLAVGKDKRQLINELKELRAETSWLIHQLEQGKCKF